MGLALGIGIGIPFTFGGESGPSVAITGLTISEDAASGTAVGVLSVANGSGVYTFSITDDPDNKFTLNGDGVTLETDATLDYETATSHSVTITADNGVADPIERVFSVSVLDVFEPPIDAAYVSGDIPAGLWPWQHSGVGYLSGNEITSQAV